MTDSACVSLRSCSATGSIPELLEAPRSSWKLLHLLPRLSGRRPGWEVRPSVIRPDAVSPPLQTSSSFSHGFEWSVNIFLHAPSFPPPCKMETL